MSYTFGYLHVWNYLPSKTITFIKRWNNSRELKLHINRFGDPSIELMRANDRKVIGFLLLKVYYQAYKCRWYFKTPEGSYSWVREIGQIILYEQNQICHPCFDWCPYVGIPRVQNKVLSILVAKFTNVYVLDTESIYLC